MGESKGINISNSLVVVVFCCSRNLHAKNYFVEKGVGLERRATIGRHVLRGDDLYPFSPLFVWNIPFSFRALKKKRTAKERERQIIQDDVLLLFHISGPERKTRAHEKRKICLRSF